MLISVNHSGPSSVRQADSTRESFFEKNCDEIFSFDVPAVCRDKFDLKANASEKFLQREVPAPADRIEESKVNAIPVVKSTDHDDFENCNELKHADAYGIGNKNFDSSNRQISDNPSITTDENLQPAKKHEMPEWQRILADQISGDLLDCVVNETHEDFMGLLDHSYLDPKGWSLEQRYTFAQLVKGAYKSDDNRYVIPLVFNSKIKKLSN